MSDEFGYLEGDTCRRNGCEGTIQERPVENCSCHLYPPCSSCTAPRAYCDECEWDEADEPQDMSDRITIDISTGFVTSISQPREFDRTKIDWKFIPHTHFTMKKVGVFPPGTSRKEVEAEVRGTFGGRFEKFNEETCEFSYIAYTD